MLRNTPDSFGTVAKTLHWVIALGVIGMLIVGFIMADMAPSESKWTLYGLHKSTGVMILLLVLMRLFWRLSNPVPHLPKSLNAWHHHVAKLSPFALYTLLLLVPISGFVMSQAGGHPISIYNLFTLPAILPKNDGISKLASTIHTYGAFAFVSILGLHISAALYHHFIIKNNVLRRMLPNWLLRR